MGNTAPFVVVLLLSTAAFAQRGGGGGGGFRGGGGGFRGGIGPAFGHASVGTVRSGFAGRAVAGSGFRGATHSGVVIGFNAPFSSSAAWLPFSGIPPVGPIPPFTLNTLSPGFFNAGFFGRNAGFYGRGFGSRSGFGDGYLPYGAYPLFGDYGQEFPAGPPNTTYITNNAPAALPPAYSPEPPPKPAQGIIHDYKWPSEGPPATGEAAAFTIALKDGSRRSAVAAWVQDGTLHYVDGNGKKQVLASDIIDRDATERLNKEKNLAIHLPG
jgi:hypothetical protein